MEVNQIICGDCLEVLKSWPDEFVDLIITSPPYYGLRKYGDYERQIGLEKTFDEYLKKILEITAELKRVLKKTGQFWLNFGDCYGTDHPAGSLGKNDKNPDRHALLDNSEKGRAPGISKCLMMMPERIALKMIDDQGWILRNKIKWAKQVLDFKEKKTKGSVMPTSVKDRFNESGEELYFFVKNKKYYSDLDAVRLPAQIWGERDRSDGKYFKASLANGLRGDSFNYRVRDAKRKAGQPQFRASEEEIKRYNEIPEDYGKKKLQNLDDKGKGLNRWMSGTPNYTYQKSLEARMEDTKDKNTKHSRSYNIKKLLAEVRLGIKPNTGMEPNKVNDPRGNHEGGPGSWRDFKDTHPYRNSAKKLKSMGVPATYIGATGQDHNLLNNPAGKNLPTVWLIGSEPHNFQKELQVDIDHFAIFPQALVEIPIKFGCPVKGLVLDPFMGSGTTALVARNLGRNYLGIELNPEYIKIANKRMNQEILL